jgi:superfamily I DNA/RNA helicase
LERRSHEIEFNVAYIYVDEAQFFAPVWLRALRSALNARGRLLLAADPTQGFLKRRQSWVAGGLDLRGRSTRLRNSYRKTRPILDFAAAFYRSRLNNEDERELNLPDEAELRSA